jgi:hypothetical protein
MPTRRISTARDSREENEIAVRQEAMGTRRRIVLALAFAALVAVALVGAALQIARGERPVLLAA